MTESRAVLEVVEPGLLTTVQDLGRPDGVALGVPVGGACDSWSLRVANVLAGNEPNAAALEVTLAGPTLRVLEDCRVGLAGADLDARIQPGGRPVEPGTGRVLHAGETLVFGVATTGHGLRAYLAIDGGLDVPRVLGSASTCLVGRFGGLDGRPLAVGDVIASRAPAGAPDGSDRSWVGGPRPAWEASRRPLRVLPGPHADEALRDAFEQLVGSGWTVSARGDRQGIRLDGGAFLLPGALPELVSQGVVWGAIQMPPDGGPICLLADRQTVGGYPVVAVVITADLPLLGQLGPTDPVRFAAVSKDEALLALRHQESEFSNSTRRLAIT